jgi:exodeoxyribonuclease VII small subunit
MLNGGAGVLMARRKTKQTESTAADNAVDADVSIEDAMQELSGVVSSLEGGQESLDESLQLFERGMSLLRVCHKQLDAAAQRIEIITKLTDEGDVQSSVFDSTSTASKKESSRKGKDAGGELF